MLGQIDTMCRFLIRQYRTLVGEFHQIRLKMDTFKYIRVSHILHKEIPTYARSHVWIWVEKKLYLVTNERRQQRKI